MDIVKLDILLSLAWWHAVNRNIIVINCSMEFDIVQITVYSILLNGKTQQALRQEAELWYFVLLRNECRAGTQSKRSHQNHSGSK